MVVELPVVVRVVDVGVIVALLVLLLLLLMLLSVLLELTTYIFDSLELLM